jgi:hypothetical protein
MGFFTQLSIAAKGASVLLRLPQLRGTPARITYDLVLTREDGTKQTVSATSHFDPRVEWKFGNLMLGMYPC